MLADTRAPQQASAVATALEHAASIASFCMQRTHHRSGAVRLTIVEAARVQFAPANLRSCAPLSHLAHAVPADRRCGHRALYGCHFDAAGRQSHRHDACRLHSKYIVNEAALAAPMQW